MPGMRTFHLRRIAFGLVLLILPCVAAQAAAQATFVNLIANPNFDNNLGLTNWSPSNTSGVQFVATDDQNNSPSSGSAAITSEENAFTSLSQCVQLPANWRSLNLSMSFWTNNPPIQITGPGRRGHGLQSFGSAGDGLVDLWYDSEPNCGGLPSHVISRQAYFAGYTDGNWHETTNPITPPPGTVSVLVILESLNLQPQEQTTVLFDSIFLGYPEVGGPPTCGGNPTVLCVNTDRFQVTAQFAIPCNTGSNFANGIQDTTQGGFLWCFDPNNPEIFVKVLNACSPSLTDSYWVFISGLTNVGVTITVTDTKTGQHKVYNSPQNTAFVPVQDTTGLHVCP